MGVYEDMANDAGYNYGTEENSQMALYIQEQEYHQIREYYERELYELECYERQQYEILKEMNE